MLYESSVLSGQLDPNLNVISMSFFIPLLPFLYLASSANAWGATGHQAVATIAQMNLVPTALERICTLLRSPIDKCYLAEVASWADNAKNNMPWSASMHYIGAVDDHPFNSCIFPSDKGWESQTNVLRAIANYTDILQDPDRDEREKNVALKFIIHFLGDMHQPLHLTGLGRGGNNAKAKFGKREDNLHAIWDSSIISKSVNSIPSQFKTPLDPSLERHIWAGNPGQSTVDIRPYIRSIVHGIETRWANEKATWSACPVASAPSLWTQALKLTPFSTWLDLAGEVSGQTSWDTGVICPYSWAQPIHKLNCELPVWPRNLTWPEQDLVSDHNQDRDHNHNHPGTVDEEMELLDARPHAKKNGLVDLDVPWYTGVIQENFVIERLLAQAGFRLAATLNAIFSSPL